jgi:hypothetical protein
MESILNLTPGAFLKRSLNLRNNRISCSRRSCSFVVHTNRSRGLLLHLLFVIFGTLPLEIFAVEVDDMLLADKFVLCAKDPLVVEDGLKSRGAIGITAGA